MKIKEVRELKDNELKDKLTELQKELMKQYAQVAMGTPPKSPGLIRKSKKAVARMMTVQRERELKKR